MKALSYLFMQSIVILQPVETGKGNNKVITVDTENIEALKKFKFLESDCKCEVITKKVKSQTYYGSEGEGFESKMIYTPVIMPKYIIKLSGPKFEYQFAPETITTIWAKFKKLASPCKLPIIMPETKDFKEVLTLNKEQRKQFKEVSGFTEVKDYNIMFKPFTGCVNFYDGYMIATDCHMLIRREINFDGYLAIPLKMIKFINSSKSDITIYRSNKELKAVNETANVIVNNEITEAPDILKRANEMLTNTNKYKAVVNRKKLIECIRQTANGANMASGLLKLNFKGEAMTVSGQDIDWSTESITELTAKSNFTGTIGFKYALLLQVLCACKNETVCIYPQDSKSATFFDDILAMPMMLNEKTEELKAYSSTINKAMLLTPILDGKYSRRRIMLNAWIILRQDTSRTWSECLKLSWSYAKEMKDKTIYKIAA